MPPLHTLQRPVMSTQRRIGMVTLRGYLGVAFLMVVVKIVGVGIHGTGGDRVRVLGGLVDSDVA